MKLKRSRDKQNYIKNLIGNKRKAQNSKIKIEYNLKLKIFH